MTEKQTLADLRKSADALLAADHVDRRGTAQLLYQLIVKLHEDEKEHSHEPIANP